MTKLYADDVSKKFRSIVEKLGPAVAEDEKLFFFREILVMFVWLTITI